jgi:hypothetical protein
VRRERQKEKSNDDEKKGKQNCYVCIMFVGEGGREDGNERTMMRVCVWISFGKLMRERGKD